MNPGDEPDVERYVLWASGRKNLLFSKEKLNSYFLNRARRTLMTIVIKIEISRDENRGTAQVILPLLKVKSPGNLPREMSYFAARNNNPESTRSTTANTATIRANGNKSIFPQLISLG
jgi:hypothetical protein